MAVLLGVAIVLAGIFGGFVLEGGHLGPLYQPYELLMIAGGALGAFVISNDAKAMRATVAAIPTLFQGPKQTNALYLDLLSLLYDILGKIRKEGLMSVESDIDNPEQSALFVKFPSILADHHLTEFITDYLRLMVSGNMDPFQIENLMDNEIEVHHQDGEIPIHAITKLAYGVFGPIASLLERKLQESTKIYQCVKVTLIASLNGYAPTLAVEFGRKLISAVQRPSFAEMESHFKQQKSR
ncbi:motility-associated protein [Duganella levis]|uniref:Flagellar motor stator protein MotA n=1 Tax=Duganella levis TaxID=2692169 RepID=A0ABW9W5K1_9BURK|nr:motility-associated protein [Duganella levis]MYN29022.1 flagellar motor stator protein MotA [Duganella levis]